MKALSLMHVYQAFVGHDVTGVTFDADRAPGPGTTERGKHRAAREWLTGNPVVY